MDDPTLTEALAARGLSHRKGAAPGYSHEILRGNEVVFTGTAAETWTWLRSWARPATVAAAADAIGRTERRRVEGESC